MNRNVPRQVTRAAAILCGAAPGAWARDDGALRSTLNQCDAIAHYRFESGTAGSPASGVGTIIDSIGTAHGTPAGGPVYREDIGADMVVSCACERNAISLELAPPQSVRVEAPFIFHHPYGDATLEFLVKPRQQGHVSLFWTRGDDLDQDRYNIAINSDGGFGFDYRAPSGELHLIPAHISVFRLPLDIWSHVAVVRDVTTLAPAHRYQFYVDGSLVRTILDSMPDLPTSEAWQISGRTGSYCSGGVDEIRFTPQKLTPAEFAVGGDCQCYADCDESGELDFFDFLCFQNLFGAADPRADCDGSGALDFFDFLCFQNEFGAGCP